MVGDTEYILRCSRRQDVDAALYAFDSCPSSEQMRADDTYIAQRMLSQDSLPEVTPTATVSVGEGVVPYLEEG